MTPREKKLREVLNVRLDGPLAGELARVAAGWNKTESEAARALLGYGIEVVRRLESVDFVRPFAWQEAAEDWEGHRPGIVDIQASYRPMTDEELIARKLYEFLPDEDEAEYWERQAEAAGES
jgi:hypothetical protein